MAGRYTFAMFGIDFDFGRYVGYRRGVVEKRARDGAAYSYAGERKVRRAVASAKPVTLAIEATTRLWKNAARSELLGTSIRATDQQLPRVYAAGRQAAASLGLTAPPIYVAPAADRPYAHALGTDDDIYIVISADLPDMLTDLELIAALGHELGHVQNNHVVYNTALYYLEHSAAIFVRWIVQPAIMALQGWARRAEITCDRAALICARDVKTTMSAMIKSSLGAGEVDVEDYLKNLPEKGRGVGRYAELFRSHPYLPKRARALEVFAESNFYRTLTGASGGGKTADQVDAEVAEILAVF